MNNRLKIVFMVLPSKLWEDFLQKKLLMREQKLLGQKNYGEVVLNRRTNDQIMARFRSFMSEKCIYSRPNLNTKSSLED